MNLAYSDRFIKDLKKLKNTPIYQRLIEFAFEELNHIDTLQHIPNLKKIKGYTGFYRIRIDDYRIGLTVSKGQLTLMRALHRKDIYKYFPD